MTTFKTTESPFKANNTASNRAGFTLMNNQVGEVVAQVMSTKPNVTVMALPSMIRVDAVGRMDVETTREASGDVLARQAHACAMAFLRQTQGAPVSLRQIAATAGTPSLTQGRDFRAALNCCSYSGDGTPAL